MREMDVVGVRVEMPSNQPIVLLREVTGERYLPIWIGAVEATGQRLVEVRIVDMQDSIFFAQLVFDGGAEVGARPSDSIALALRTGTRIVCAEAVLDEAGLAVPAEQEDEVERFREFLDHVSPDDFESP